MVCLLLTCLVSVQCIAQIKGDDKFLLNPLPWGQIHPQLWTTSLEIQGLRLDQLLWSLPNLQQNLGGLSLLLFICLCVEWGLKYPRLALNLFSAKDNLEFLILLLPLPKVRDYGHARTSTPCFVCTRDQTQSFVCGQVLYQVSYIPNPCWSLIDVKHYWADLTDVVQKWGFCFHGWIHTIAQINSVSWEQASDKRVSQAPQAPVQCLFCSGVPYLFLCLPICNKDAHSRHKYHCSWTFLSPETLRHVFFFSFKLLSLWCSVIAMESWKWHQFFKWWAFEFPGYLAKFRFMPSRPCLWSLSICPCHKLQGNANSANQTTSSNNQILILAYSQCQCEYWFESNKDYVLQFSVPALHNGHDL